MTTPEQIIYEHPLNERIRTILRLEHLFRLALHYTKGQSSWDSRVFVTTLIDILDIFSRGDLKNELIKELERSANNLNNLMANPHVDSSRLTTILKAMEHLIDNLHGMKNQPGHELREDEFLNVVRQRSTIPGGTCDFDLPAYHRWLQQPWPQREAMQKSWFAQLDPIRQAIELLLKMIRNSADPVAAQSDAGSYQQSLDSSHPFQLLRVALDGDSPYYAEISGNRHRVNIRFLQTAGGRPQLADQTVNFTITCCSL
ncbi:MAG: cell division protein ZapD [Gammaproteobacteria bacterium]|nr:cell division protein ZapD [Gammaproteobacteria bacterium]